MASGVAAEHKVTEESALCHVLFEAMMKLIMS